MPSKQSIIDLQQILHDYKQKKTAIQSLKRAIIFIFYLAGALFLLNLCVGIVLYSLKLSTSIFWHSSSILVIALYLVCFVVKILYYYEQIIRHESAFAQKINAQKIDLPINSIEQQVFYDLNQQVAQALDCPAVDIYVLNDAGINSFHFGLIQQHSMIFITWGMLYHFTPQELKRILAWHYVMILSGEAQERSLYTIYLQGYLFGCADVKFYQCVAQLKQQYHILNSLQLCYLFVQKSLAKVDKTIHYYVQSQLFQPDALDFEFAKLDEDYVHILIRAYLNPLPVYGYDMVSLAPLLFIQSAHGVYGTAQDLLERRIKKIHSGDFCAKTPSIYHYIQQTRKQADVIVDYRTYQDFKYLKEQVLIFDYTKNKRTWQNKFALPTIETAVQPMMMDSIRPLNPQLRTQQAQQYLQEIFPTAQHYLHVISFVFEIRKTHSVNSLQSTDISATVWSVLHKMDRRLLCEIFELCYPKIQLPLVVIEPYLYQWAEIAQNNQKIHVLDALMLEKLKAHWQLLAPHYPQVLNREIVQDIVQLTEAILCVQPFMIAPEIKQQAFEYAFGDLYRKKEIKPCIDYHHIFGKLSGLRVQDRLIVVGVIEYLLCYHDKLTQDGFDVLVLLYWRLGFDSEQLKHNLYKRHQIAIW